MTIKIKKAKSGNINIKSRRFKYLFMTEKRTD